MRPNNSAETWTMKGEKAGQKEHDKGPVREAQCLFTYMRTGEGRGRREASKCTEVWRLKERREREKEKEVAGEN